MWKYFLRKREGWSPYFEVSFFVGAYLLMGYLIRESDILFISYDRVYITLFLAIATLYYGTEKGVFSLAIFGLVHFTLYDVFEYPLFLKELILILILGKFHDYWRYKLRESEEKSFILHSQLDELGTAYYALKISHDQLEMNYVLRPISLRRVLTQIIEDFKHQQDQYRNLLILLMKTFNITRMAICTVNKGQVSVQVSSEEGSEVDPSDPLIRRALEEAKPIYIAQHVESESVYIAVIPAIEAGEVKAIILIEDMPFMSFHEDNMLAISFFFEFFYLTLHREHVLHDFTLLQGFDNDFRFEYLRLYTLYEKYGIDSAVIVFKTRSALSSHMLNEKIRMMERGLDTSDSMRYNDIYITMVLTSFTITSSADVLRRRILESLKQEDQERIEVATFLVSQQTLLREFIGCADDMEA